MNKIILIILSVISITYSNAQTKSYTPNPASVGVVLGFDMSIFGHNRYVFPCQSYMGVLFCDNRLVIEDESCNRSLRFIENKARSQTTIVCNIRTSEQIMIATTRKHSPFMRDETLEAMGYYYLDFSPRVSLVKQKLHPNGLTQSFLVIK